MIVEVTVSNIVVDQSAVVHGSKHLASGTDPIALGTKSAAGIVQMANTGIADATKVPSALGADLVALITAAGYTLNPATGTASLDGIADGTTYKRILAAIATALNAGTYDAASVATRGIGTATPPAMVTSCDTYNIGGLYTDSGALTNSPWSGSASRILVLPISTTNVTQLAFRNGANHIRIREYAASGWTAWKEVWTADSDGNGGQPPQPKTNVAGSTGSYTQGRVLCGILAASSVLYYSGATNEAGTWELEILATNNAARELYIGSGQLTASTLWSMSYKAKRIA